MYFSFLFPAVFVWMPLSFGMSMRIFLNVVMVVHLVYGIFSVYSVVGCGFIRFVVCWALGQNSLEPFAWFPFEYAFI